MPRLVWSILRHAYNIDPLLPRLLATCGDLCSARNELRWLREHAVATTARPQWHRTLRMLIAERASGKPLQYVLGNQPFGDLEVLCEKGVLIPRSVFFPSLLSTQ